MPAEQVAEDDYQSFCEALGSTARGRAFLDEYARRNRQVDTKVVLAALDRLEATARSQSAASPDAERIRQDLRALLDTLRSARPQSENSPTAIKAATLAALIDFTQARIEALVLPAREDEPLSAVPADDQPELPIPHPAASAVPQMMLVQPALRGEAPEAPAMKAPVVEPTTVAPQNKRKTATIIPIVEFDYHGHPNARIAPARSEPDEAWSTLAPPSVALPQAAPIPAAASAAAPASPMPAASAAMPATPVLPEVSAPQKPEKVEVEPYELWLDPPAAAEPDATETLAADPMPDVAVMSDVTVSISEAAPVAAAADTGAPTAEAAIETIETLMQQMEEAAAPPVKGHIEVPDPLAPLMALSDDERTALFT